MHILSIGFFAPDYIIALANALASSNTITLFLSKRNIGEYFPNCEDLEKQIHDKELLESGINLRLLNYPVGHYLQKLESLLNLLREIYRIHPDIIHYQSGGDPWFPLIMPWLSQYSLVVTIHDVTAHPGGSTSYLFQAIKNFVVSHLAYQIIVHGQQQAKLLIRNYRISPKKVNIIPIGSYDMFAAISNQEVMPDDRAVLFFGSLRPNKGIDVLLRAVPLIAAEVPGVRFIIAGAGDYPSVHKQAAEHPDWFEVNNQFVKAEEVHIYFQRAAIVVMPYIEASQSGVLPLAYLFERPVVATRVGSIPEIMEDGITGYLIEPNDEIALAHAIVRLLNDKKLREEMGKAGAAKLDKELSWHVIAEKTLDVYEKAKISYNSKPRKSV